MSEDVQKTEEIVVDEQKLKKIIFKIWNLERQNVIAHDKSPSQMNDEIRKIIETEVKKCY